MTIQSVSLDDLDPDWLRWICEALSSRASTSQIVRALKERGDPNPVATIAAVQEHPIFKWAIQQQISGKRAQTYLKLQETLWEMRETTLPRLSAPSQEYFYEHFYLAHRPVIITDWVKHWDAVHTWNPQNWVEKFADVPIEISARRNTTPQFDRNFTSTEESTTLGAFAHELLSLSEPSNDRYLIARNYALRQPELKSLWDDIDEHHYLNPLRREGNAALWFGPEGTYTPLHHDTCQIMFAQIWGDKHFSLIPAHAQSLYRHATNMYSDLPFDLDLAKHPQHPHQIELTLKAGEALFIPVGWWHAVRSLSVSISVAMTHFYAKNDFAWYQPGRD